jgi:hypothetical protein
LERLEVVSPLISCFVFAVLGLKTNNISNLLWRPGGLSAVLRSRHTSRSASHGIIYWAALRGTCFYPWRSPTTTPQNHLHPGKHTLPNIIHCHNDKGNIQCAIFNIQCSIHTAIVFLIDH